MQLGSYIAVAVVQAGSCSSDSTPILGTSICPRCGPEKQKKKKKERENQGMPTTKYGMMGGGNLSVFHVQMKKL